MTQTMENQKKDQMPTDMQKENKENEQKKKIFGNTSNLNSVS
jgi:hypothetical protein